MAARLGGAAASRYTISQNAEINVTPFVDVMMVLLVIFMVAIPLATKSISLDFPPTPPNHTVVPQVPTYVSIRQGGAIFIGDASTTRATLIADLKAKVSVKDRILIRADADVDYGDFMNIMNELKANGFTQVSLIGEDIT